MEATAVKEAMKINWKAEVSDYPGEGGGGELLLLLLPGVLAFGSQTGLVENIHEVVKEYKTTRSLLVS